MSHVIHTLTRVGLAVCVGLILGLPNRGVGQTSACRVGPIPVAAEVIGLDVSRGRAISTATFGDKGPLTTVVDVHVPDGETLLVLALSSRSPVVARLQGATDRIASAMILTDVTGIAGLPPQRVSLLGGAACAGQGWSESARASQNAERFAALTGHSGTRWLPQSIYSQVDLGDGSDTVGHAYPNGLRVDLGGRAGAVWRAFLRRYPGGVVQIDPAAVIATHPVKEPEVLPTVAGLAQLVERGSLEVVSIDARVKEVFPTADGTIVLGNMRITGDMPEDGMTFIVGDMNYRLELDGIWRGRSPMMFRILRSLRLPDGAGTYDTIRYRLAPGVPRPRNLGSGTDLFME
ncbi:MAG: hypothetical protein AAGE38_12530 [Pseudomonadota bacterium]